MQPISSAAGVALCTGASALDLPPVDCAVVPAAWNGTVAGTVAATAWQANTPVGAVPEVDVSIWADTDRAITDAELFGGELHAMAYVAATFTFDHTTGKVAKTGHALLTGDGPLDLSNTGGAVPAGLDATVPYWWIKFDADHGFLALSLDDALNGVAVEFTGNGTGTNKLTGEESMQRVHWASHGLLGPAGDGAITLDAQLAQWQTVPHRPRVVAYAISATLGEGSGLVSAAVYPVVDAR